MYVPTTELVFPQKAPGDVLPMALDMGQVMADTADTIVSVAVSARPSGAGELVLSDLTVDSSSVVRFWASGGVSGRRQGYLVSALVVCASGAHYQVLATVPMDRAATVYPVPPAPSNDFGPPITWNGSGAVVNGLLGADGVQLLGADGAALVFGSVVVADGLLGGSGARRRYPSRP